MNRITLLDSLSEDWIKLPYAAMREVDSAAQTLGGLLKITKKDTYVSVAKIAMNAMLPVRTVREHLPELAEKGWIVNAGRERTRRGPPRRTCTRRMTRKSTAPQKYGILPWWACTELKMTWGQRAVLSVLMAGLAGLKSAYLKSGGRVDPPHAFWAEFHNEAEVRHFAYSLRRLREITGLSNGSLIDAKRWLEWRGIIVREQRRFEHGGYQSDLLLLNPTFAIEVDVDVLKLPRIHLDRKVS